MRDLRQATCWFAAMVAGMIAGCTGSISVVGGGDASGVADSGMVIVVEGIELRRFLADVGTKDVVHLCSACGSGTGILFRLVHRAGRKFGEK